MCYNSRQSKKEWLDYAQTGDCFQASDRLDGPGDPILEEADSTNLRAKAAAGEGADAGLVILAEQQTDGRGRRGRAWQSPAGENIYMTVLLRPDFEPEKAPMLTLLAACAAAGR